MRKLKTNLIPMNEALEFYDGQIRNLRLEGRLPANTKEFELQAMRVIDLLRGNANFTGEASVILNDPAVLHRIDELCAQVMGTSMNHPGTQVARDLMANTVRNAISSFGSLNRNIRTTLIYQTVVRGCYNMDINNRLYTSLSGFEFNRVNGWSTPNNPPTPNNQPTPPTPNNQPTPPTPNNQPTPPTPNNQPTPNNPRPQGPTPNGPRSNDPTITNSPLPRYDQAPAGSGVNRSTNDIVAESNNLWPRIVNSYKTIISQPIGKFGKVLKKHPMKSMIIAGVATYGSIQIYNMIQNQGVTTFNGIVDLLRVNLNELYGIKKDTAMNQKLLSLLNALIQVETNFIKAAENCQKMIKTENANIDAIIAAFYSSIAPIVAGRNNLINSGQYGLNVSNSRDARIRVIIISEDAALQAQFKKYQIVAKQAEQLVVDKISDPVKPNAPIVTGNPKVDEAKKKADEARQKAEAEMSKNNTSKSFWSYLSNPGAPRTVMFVLGGAAFTYGLWKLGQKLKLHYQEWKMKRAEASKDEEGQEEQTPTPTTQNPYTF